MRIAAARRHQVLRQLWRVVGRGGAPSVAAGNASATTPQPKTSKKKLSVIPVATITVALAALAAFIIWNFFIPKEFNGTVLFSSYDSDGNLETESTITVQGDEVSWAEKSDSSDLTDGFTAKIKERSQTESTYIFELDDTEKRIFDDETATNRKVMLYLPKNLDSDSLEGNFGITKEGEWKDNDEAGNYYFELVPFQLFRFEEDGNGTATDGYAILKNKEDFEKVDIASDQFDLVFIQTAAKQGGVNMGVHPVSWSKVKEKFLITPNESDSDEGMYEISLTELR